nr:maturase K [Diplopterygium chinense]QYC92943.1 maturase K [Diplopterygium chinense]
MRTEYRFSSKFDKFWEKKRIDPKWECFSYTLLFRDDIYSIAYSRYSNRSSIHSIENSTFSERYGVISMKRLINGIRQQDLLGMFYSEFDQIRFEELRKNPYSEALLKVICLVLEISSTLTGIEHLSIRETSEWKSFRSIHSLFLFMENRFLHSNYILDTKIPYNPHSEALIRMFRRQIRDAPFPHLSRSSFQRYRKFLINSSPRAVGGNSLATSLRNFYMYEIESLLVPLWKKFSGLQSASSVAISDRNNIFLKGRRVDRSHPKSSKKDSCLTKSSSIHYGRYGNRFLLALVGTNYSAKKWIYYILAFIEFHSHCWFHSHRMCIRKLSRNCVLFLGYILGVQSIIGEVQVGTLTESHITVSIIKESLFQAPTSLLIESMSRGSFCDNFGRPVSRSARTTLTDDDILKRFVQIWKILSLYHSGSINRDGLNRSRYILRFSCDKTLSCKHKSTIRLIRRRLDSGIFLKTPRENSEVSPSYKSRSISKNRRFWYLEITQPITLLLNRL